MGFQPVVAHPERYDYVQRMPHLLNIWSDMGCLLQINRGSLLGRFGERAEALSHSLLMRDFVTCIASDAHTASVRTPWLKDIYAMLSEEYSEHLAERLLMINPQLILDNKILNLKEPNWF